jgi:hypothetical protein
MAGVAEIGLFDLEMASGAKVLDPSIPKHGERDGSGRPVKPV